MSLAADVLVLLRDLLALGLAVEGSWGDPPAAVVLAIEDAGRPPQYDAGGEVEARTATATAAQSQMPSPRKGQPIIVSAGPWAGAWTIVEVGAVDDGSWTLQLRADDLVSVRSPGARRLAGGGAP
jgi:hypothetical protein